MVFDNHDLTAVILARLPAAELPPLRRVNQQWHCAIDRILAAAVGPTVLDAAGYSTELVEFWIRAGRGYELFCKAQNIKWFLPYLASIPRLLTWMLGYNDPDHLHNVEIALAQVIHDRPLIAAKCGSEKLWMAAVKVSWSIFTPVGTWRQANDTYQTYTRLVHSDFGDGFASSVTHRDIRTAVLYSIVCGNVSVLNSATAHRLITITPEFIAAIINVAAAAAMIGSDTHRVFTAVAALGEYRREDVSYARTVFEELEQISYNLTLIDRLRAVVA